MMSIYCKKRCNSQSANSKDKKPSLLKAESADFPGGYSRESRKFSLKTRKSRFPKKLAPKSKKLELNSTTTKLKSKKTW